MIVITDAYFLINNTCIPCNFALDYSLNFSATPLPRTQALPSVWIPLHSRQILLPPSLLRLLLHIETPFPSFCSVLNILLKLVLTISFLTVFPASIFDCIPTILHMVAKLTFSN